MSNKLKGELWSFLRTVLEQGAAIQQDYDAGKYHSYEEYAARVDEAARERVDSLFLKLWGTETEGRMTDEKPGMLSLIEGVEKQTWPHTVDARIWADEWIKTIAKHPNIPTDRDTMLGWFANAIMAGYDTANLRRRKPE